MPTCNDTITDTDLSANPPSLPPWLCHSNSRPPPSVTLSLSTSTIIHSNSSSSKNSGTEILHRFKELEESRQLLEAHKKEANWRMRRVELLLESEKVSRKRQKVEEIEAKIEVIKDEGRVSLERIEMEYREQLTELTRESEVKELKLTEQWTSKHLKLANCIQRVNNGVMMPEANARRI